MINIAIDGPSGAGKSTIAKRAAKALGYVYIDTGAMYRTVGLYLLRAGIDIKTEHDKVLECLSHINIDIKYISGNQHIFLNDEDVTSLIRTPEISMAASYSGTVKEIREKMTAIQRTIAENNNCIMDGRDIGSFVLPNAEVKIFLTADVTVRAKRRCAELKEKGEEVTFDEVLRSMIERDKNDSTREFMPLRKADDAFLLDTTDLSLDEATESVINIIKNKINEQEVGK